MKKNNSKSIDYNLLVKNLIISSVLFSLVFFDMKLQDFRTGSSSARQIDFTGTLNVSKDQIREEFTVELLHMNEIVETIDLSAADSFSFQLASNSIYQLKISRGHKSCSEITIFTRQPEQAFNKEIHAVVDLTKSAPAALNLPPDLIAWDYDSGSYAYIEDNTLQNKNRLYSENIY